VKIFVMRPNVKGSAISSGSVTGHRPAAKFHQIILSRVSSFGWGFPSPRFRQAGQGGECLEKWPMAVKLET